MVPRKPGKASCSAVPEPGTHLGRRPNRPEMNIDELRSDVETSPSRFEVQFPHQQVRVHPRMWEENGPVGAPKTP